MGSGRKSKVPKTVRSLRRAGWLGTLDSRPDPIHAATNNDQNPRSCIDHPSSIAPRP
jgi:hypothetical protein